MANSRLPHNPTEDTPISENQHSDAQNTNVYQNKQDEKLDTPNPPAQKLDKSEQLREAILGIVHLVGCQCHAAGWNDNSDGKDSDSLEEVERLEEIATEELIALFQKEQIQLVSELLSKPTIYATTVGHVTAVPVSVLAHKKQELERGSR